MSVPASTFMNEGSDFYFPGCCPGIREWRLRPQPRHWHSWDWEFSTREEIAKQTIYPHAILRSINHDCQKYVYRGWRDEADCGFIEGRIEMELLACDESLQISWHKKSKFLCFCHPKMNNAVGNNSSQPYPASGLAIVVFTFLLVVVITS